MAKDTVDFQIIANLMAGKKSGGQILEKLERFLKDNNKTFSTLLIDHPAPISKLPKDGHHITEGLICIGGDGTVSESVAYILKNKLELPLAIIPTGTANLIANSLGIENHFASFDFLLEKKFLKIDIGVADYGVEKNYFLLGFGLGFEEKFLKITKERIKSFLGIFSYIFSAASELFALRKIPVKIRIDERIIETEVCTLLLLNMPPKILKYFPLFIDESIRENTGLLNLYYVEYKNFFHALLGTTLLHILGRSFGMYKSFSGRNFEFESLIPVGTQIDGELKRNLPVKISVLPSSFSFLI